MAAASDWEKQFDSWVAPFARALGAHPQPRRSLDAYLRGLILPGERKSLEPLAARVVGPGSGRYQSLHHFVADSPWDAGPLEEQLARQAQRIAGGDEAFLEIDDTALPKKGTHSAGVAPQYCGALGKMANCQSVVTLTLARGEVPLCVATRLFLPKAWTDDPERCRRAKVPEAVIAGGHRTKIELAIEELDRLRERGVTFGFVVADAGYGASGPFRRELTRRGLAWAVGILSNTQVYPAQVEVSPPGGSGRGRPRRHGATSAEPRAARDLVAGLDAPGWKRLSWRAGTRAGRGKPLAADFSAMRVRPADGAKVSFGKRHPGGEECWLVAERREGGEMKYYLSSLPPETELSELARVIKARWSCEQAHQQMKEELGLDHFEGRGWLGLHRHMLMCRVSHCFLQHLRLGGKKKRGAPRCPTTPDAA